MEVMLSVICITYNHVNFISDAIEGFLNQKTNFRYEVIIHDDASTDGTIDIIKKYQSKYPDIIKPVFEEENQYSKGVTVSQIALSYAKGKYVAICEGDDYWTDCNKLQMQVDFLETHSEYSYSFHNANVVGIDGQFKNIFLPDKTLKSKVWKNENCTYDVADVVELGFIPTASIVTYRKYYENYEHFCDNPVCGDLPLRLHLALKGKAYYINKNMSAYRTDNPSSASGIASANPKNAYVTLKGHIDILNGFNKYTEYKYNDSVMHDIGRRKLRYYMSYPQSEYNDKNIKKLLLKELTFHDFISFILRTKYNGLYQVVRYVYNIFKRQI